MSDFEVCAIGTQARLVELERCIAEILRQIDQGGSGGKVFARDACIGLARSLLQGKKQIEPTRSQQMADAGFTPRDNRLQCDECGGKFSRQMLPIHNCPQQAEPVAMDDRTAAQHRLDHGAQFPYDAPDAWWEMAAPKPLPATDWAHAAARGILADLTDRRGIKWSLQEIDEDVRAELVASLAEIIRAALAQAEPVERKPLTEDEIDKFMQRIGLRCADEGNPLMTNHAEWQRRTIARAIELARDIKEAK